MWLSLCPGVVAALAEEGSGPRLEQKLSGLGASWLSSLSMCAFALPSTAPSVQEMSSVRTGDVGGRLARIESQCVAFSPLSVTPSASAVLPEQWRVMAASSASHGQAFPLVRAPMLSVEFSMRQQCLAFVRLRLGRVPGQSKETGQPATGFNPPFQPCFESKQVLAYYLQEEFRLPTALQPGEPSGLSFVRPQGWDTHCET